MENIYHFYLVKYDDQIVGLFKLRKKALRLMNHIKSVDNKIDLKLELVTLINNDQVKMTDCNKER